MITARAAASTSGDLAHQHTAGGMWQHATMNPPAPLSPAPHRESGSSPDYGLQYDPQSDIESGRDNAAGGRYGYHASPHHPHNGVAASPRSVSSTPSSIASSSGGGGRASLRCALDSSATLYDILQTLLLERDQRCTITLMAAGLKFTVSKSNSVCAKVYMKKLTFSSYYLRADAEHSRFDVSCTTLLQCLTIFGKESNTHVSIEWADIGEPLSLTLEDQGTITQCSIPTFE